MKRHIVTTTAAALLALTAPAVADCAAELEKLRGAALAGESGQAEAGSGEVIKDGSVAPLETDDTLATSGQDIEAQQEGGDTAAMEAREGDDPGRQEALDRAQAALDAGDEDACMAALEEARAM